MEDGKFVSTNSYFTSFYFFTALHGLHLLGGLFFWGKVCSQILKLDEKKILDIFQDSNHFDLSLN